MMQKSPPSSFLAPPLGELARQRLRGRTSLRRQLPRPLRHGLRRATSPKGRGLGKEMKFTWTAKGSPFGRAAEQGEAERASPLKEYIIFIR